MNPKILALEISIMKFFQLIHGEPLGFVCPICGKKQFARRDHFRTHVSTHNNQKLPCEVSIYCYLYYFNETIFIYQMANTQIISQKPIHFFQFCGKTFADNNKRRRHIIEVHEQRKNHMCNTCGKSSNISQ